MKVKTEVAKFILKNAFCGDNAFFEIWVNERLQVLKDKGVIEDE